MKKKHSFNRLFSNLLLWFIILIATFPARSQSVTSEEAMDWVTAMTIPDANYWEIRTIVENYYASNPDAKGYSSFRRWATYWETRVGKVGNIGSFQPAFDSWNNIFNNNEFTNTCDEGGNWIPLGPFEFPDPLGTGSTSAGVGRITKVKVDLHDPTFNTVYVGGSSYGLWKTTNSMAQEPIWECLTCNTNLPLFGVLDIAIDPNDPNVIFIATGVGNSGANPMYGMGIVKSIDGGETWNTTGLSVGNYAGNNWDFNEFLLCRNVLIHPENTNRIYASSAGKVFVSNDGGANFELIFAPNGSDLKILITDLKFNPDDPNLIYVTTQDEQADNGGAKLYITNDDFQTFQTFDESDFGLLDPLARIDLAFHNNAPENIYLSASDPLGNYLILSTDNGNTWTATPDLMQGNMGSWFKQEIAVSQIDPQTIYFGGVTHFGTIDSGNSTSSISSNSFSSTRFVHDDLRSLEIYHDFNAGNDVLFSGHDGGISVAIIPPNTPLNAITWTDISGKGLNIAQFFGVGVAENYSAIGGGAIDMGLFTRYRDGNFVKPPPYADGSIVTFDKFNSDRMFGVTFSSNTNGTARMSNNQGQSWTTIDFGIGAGDSYQFQIKPHSNGLTYAAAGDVFKRDFDVVNGTWTKLGNIIPDIRFVALAISNDEEYIYVGDRGAGSLGSPLSRKFLRTTNGNDSNPSNVQWEDLTQPLLDAGFLAIEEGSGLRDLIVSPTDRNKIWVSNGSFDKPNKVFFSPCGGSPNDCNEPWINVSNGLPNFPINTLEYHEGTNDVVYAGTDIGVYVNYDASNPESHWECFNNGLPIVNVMDLQINSCENKLVAATFGRGFWETQLNVTGEFADIEITENTEWENKRIIRSNITIQEGATLFVNGEVHMATGKQILVKRGGKLIVNGGVLTNICSGLWKGVFVEGDGESPQGTAFQPGQGFVELEPGTIIENAEVGVSLAVDGALNSSGGIIVARGATFRNNKRAIYFEEFQNTYFGTPLGNASEFNECVFEINDDFIPSVDNFKQHIYLKRVTGIDFRACKFYNNNNAEVIDPFDKGRGIESIDSEFKVSGICSNPIFPCQEYENSEFSGFYYGVLAYNMISVNPFSISRTDFLHNHTGIYASGVDNINVVLNNFTVGFGLQATGSRYNGAHLRGCSNYKIEENSFENQP